ncbi:MAG: hypothetical protein PHI85_07955 [Victivallaceae bacterium]|nr:hypothetical protein [Victivallaceae bacterium]
MAVAVGLIAVSLLFAPWHIDLKSLFDFKFNFAKEGTPSSSSSTATIGEVAEFEEVLPYGQEFFADLPKEGRFEIVTKGGSVLRCESIRKVGDDTGIFTLEGGEKSVRLRYENIERVNIGSDDV